MAAATQPRPPGPRLCIGPAGWDYPDWQGVVYAPGLKGADRLTFLAALFSAVEINVTFYRPIPAGLRPALAGGGGRGPGFPLHRQGLAGLHPRAAAAGGRTGPVSGGPGASAGRRQIGGAPGPVPLFLPQHRREPGVSPASSKPPSRTFPWPWRCATAPGSTGP